MKPVANGLLMVKTDAIKVGIGIVCVMRNFQWDFDGTLTYSRHKAVRSIDKGTKKKQERRKDTVCNCPYGEFQGKQFRSKVRVALETCDHPTLRVAFTSNHHNVPW